MSTKDWSNDPELPTEWYERNHHRKGWYGYTEEFEKYLNIQFNFFPINFDLHTLKGWRMDFKQKTQKSRCYLHFHNKNNFGFRVRLPAREYASIADIIQSCGNNFAIFKESEIAHTSIVERYVQVKSDSSLEEVLKAEQNRILNEIGDYRGTVKELPDNVIDFTEYLKEPPKVIVGDSNIENLLAKLG